MRALLVLALLAGCNHELERQLIDMRPIDEDEVVARIREDRFEYLARTDRFGNERWVVPIDGWIAERTPLLVRRQRAITVQFHEHRRGLYELFVQAVSTKDGRVVWTTPLGTFGEYPRVQLSSDPSSPTVDVVAFQSSNLLFRVDVASGAIRSELALNARAFSTLHIGPQVMFSGIGTVVVDDRGVISREEKGWRGCVIGDDYLFLDAGRELVTWVGGRPTDERRRRIELSSAWSSSIGCMAYRSHPVLLSTGYRAAGLAFIDEDAVSVLELGGEFRGAELAESQPAHSNRHGVATRFVPFLIDDRESLIARIVLVDMERRTIAWSRVAGSSRDVFRVGSYWYVVDIGATSRITVIDGETGLMRTARISGARGVLPEAIQADTLWLRSSDGVELGQLDAWSLQPRWLPPSIRVDVESESEL